MLNKLIVGRYLDLPNFDAAPPVIAGGTAVPTDFALVTAREYALQESVGSGAFNTTRTSAVTPVATPAQAHAKAHRNFRWLPWIKGKVSCTPLAGTDILTGTFTGCWAVIFRMGTTLYFGHIGTFNASDTAESIQAKAAWKNAVASGAITPLKAFKPTRQAPAKLPKGQPDVYAVATAAQEMWIAVFMKPFAGGTAAIGPTNATGLQRTANPPQQIGHVARAITLTEPDDFA